MRVFISLELPDEVKKNIDKSIAELKKTEAKVKWVKAENLHITLKFLGELKQENFEGITKAAEKAAGFGSFKIKFQNLGSFPGIVWVGTDEEGGDSLCKLAKVLDQALEKIGFEKEKREFKAHITVGRIKKGKMPKVDKGQNFGEALVDRICIMKSTLTPKGPVYEKLKEVKLQ